MIRIIYYLVNIYIFAIIIRALLSWVPATPGSALEPVVRFFTVITEPVLRPVRKILPPVRVGGMALDLSVIVVIIVAEVIVLPLLLR